ncbi:glycosyltransferase family 4 protein [bacterium]|nr:glycosyltransferase family 4 protein [bacterium]
MKILLATNDFPPEVGGIQTYCYQLAKNLASLGEKIVVLAPGVEGDLEFDKRQNFRIIRIRKKINLYFTFFSTLRRERIEKILVAHRANYACLASWANILWKIPYDIIVYGGEILLLGRRKSIRKNFERAEQVITISNFTKGRLIEIGIPEKKIAVIHPGVDPAKFNPELSPSKIRKRFNLENKKIILTISHLVKRKGHQNVLKALPQVLEKVPNLVYLIVGKGEEGEALKETVRDLKLEERVIFVGKVKEEELPLYYGACDLFIMPSYEIKEKGDVEGFGITYLEANACGKPVIGGRSGGVPDAVIDGQTGLLINPLNIDQIAQALIKLLTNSGLARKLGEGGRKRVERELNWQEMAKKIKGIIHEKS